MSARPQTKDKPTKATFQWDDPFLLDDQLTEDERMIRDTARAYAQDKLLPRVTQAYIEEKTDPRNLQRDGRAWSDRRHAAGGIRLRQCELCRLRLGRARDRARRFRLSLHEQRAVVAGDVSDLCLRR